MAVLTVMGIPESWRKVTHDDLHYRPHMMHLFSSVDLTVDGVEFRNSPNHNVYLVDSTRVRIRNLRVEAPAFSPNTDGVNFEGGQDQSIVDSHISNGDDCISVVCSDSSETKMGYGGNVYVSNMSHASMAMVCPLAASAMARSLI